MHLQFIESVEEKELHYQNEVRSGFHLYLGESSWHKMESMWEEGKGMGVRQTKVSATTYQLANHSTWSLSLNRSELHVRTENKTIQLHKKLVRCGELISFSAFY